MEEEVGVEEVEESEVGCGCRLLGGGFVCLGGGGGGGGWRGCGVFRVFVVLLFLSGLLFLLCGKSCC